MKSRYGKTAVVTICILVILGVLAGTGIYIFRNMDGHKEAVVPSGDDEGVISGSKGDTIFHQGQEYIYNKNLTNILFMGVDKSEPVSLQEMPGNAGQTDSLLLISLDSENHEAKILQISRDVMTEVDLYDVSGNYYTSVEAQIATQYAYGNGVQSSCWATRKTVSELLYELPIDGYLSLNLDAIRVMNDAVGGVTLTIPEDYTQIDPAFAAGSTVTLTGDQAERYVRFRNTDETGSNAGRMERQLQYIPALLNAVKGRSGGDYYEKYYPLLEPYLVTDMSAEQINDMAGYELNTENAETVPGEVVAGAEHDEFHVDDEKLYDLIIKMFYKPVEM